MVERWKIPLLLPPQAPIRLSNRRYRTSREEMTREFEDTGGMEHPRLHLVPIWTCNCLKDSDIGNVAHACCMVGLYLHSGRRLARYTRSKKGIVDSTVERIKRRH
jgi:hypothetical protein